MIKKKKAMLENFRIKKNGLYTIACSENSIHQIDQFISIINSIQLVIDVRQSKKKEQNISRTFSYIIDNLPFKTINLINIYLYFFLIDILNKYYKYR